MSKTTHYVLLLCFLLLVALGVGVYSHVTRVPTKQVKHLRIALFTSQYTRGLAELEDDFEAKTGFTADIRVVGQVIFENRVILSFVGKTGDMDVVHAPLIQLPRWVQAGWLQPMTEQVNAMPDKADFFSGALEAYNIKNEYWALPFFAEPGVMAYRKDILAAAGYDSPPKTWEHMLEVAEAIHNDKVAAFAMRGASGQGENMFVFPMIMRAYGGNFFTNYPEDLSPDINSPKVLAALNVYSRLMRDYGPDGVGNFKFSEVVASMQAGKTAMIVDGTSIAAQAVDPKQSRFANKIGLAAVPSGPSGRSPAIAVHGFAIPADARNPEASMAFIKWATSEDVLTKIALARPFPDFTRNSVAENPEVIAKYAGLHPDFLRVRTQAMSEAIGHYRPLLPQWPEIGASLGDNINAAVNGIVDPQVALDTAAQETAKALNDD